MRFEQDEVTLLGGVLHGQTLGRQWPSRSRTPSGPSGTRTCSRRREVRAGASPSHIRPRRPPGMQKYGFDEVAKTWNGPRPNTAARVAAGTCAKAFLGRLGVQTPQSRRPDRAAATKSEIRPSALRSRNSGSRLRSAASTRSPKPRWSREIKAAMAASTTRRGGRGHRLSIPSVSVAMSTGTGIRRDVGPSRPLHPSRRGCRNRRPRSTTRRGGGAWPTIRCPGLKTVTGRPTRAATEGRRTVPAASRAASPTENRSSCGRP